MTIELTREDEQALAWAVTAGSPTGEALSERFSRGERDVTAADLWAARREWDAAGRPPPMLHSHRDDVVLPDGTAVLAASFIGPDPYQRDDVPAFGLYLDDHWDPSWPHAHVHWPDFGVPADAVAFRAALADFLARARRGERVEVACIGGHGRTGTALACLAILVGLRPTDAVAWVRDAYCDGAVETEEQRAFVEAFDPGR